jgi:N-acyl-D-amino-acid deacylase
LVFDIVIKNGRIIDGTGNPWFRANVGVKDGKIVRISRVDISAGSDLSDKGQRGS